VPSQSPGVSALEEIILSESSLHHGAETVCLILALAASLVAGAGRRSWRAPKIEMVKWITTLSILNPVDRFPRDGLRIQQQRAIMPMQHQK